MSLLLINRSGTICRQNVLISRKSVICRQNTLFLPGYAQLLMIAEMKEEPFDR
jgi:hypothetical protein